MENMIEIQREFEILVSELERLKSINELTSTNADSAKIVVNEIDKFVKSVEHFRAAIDKDFKSKSSKIDLILKQLDETVLSIESNTKKSVNDLSQKLKELHKESDSVIKQNQEALSKELNKFAEALNNLSEIISSKITEKLQEQNSQIQVGLGNISGLINQSISFIETNFNTKFKNINEQLERNMKLSKQNRIFLLILSIVTIGLLMFLLIK